MKKIVAISLVVLFAALLCVSKGRRSEAVIRHSDRSTLPVWDEKYETALAEEYDSGAAEENLDGVQCPIPMSDRVRNHTGTQCVFSSMECLARWSDCKKLLEPEPLTSRSGCRSFSSPGDAAAKLNKFGVRFTQEYRSKEAGVALIKKSMAEGRGVLWGVPGHAMVLCHYDERANTVRWIDNSDRSLRMQTTTIEKFNARWNGWVLAIYAEPDLFPAKASKTGLPNQIPIVDHNNPQGKFPPNYIPVPGK